MLAGLSVLVGVLSALFQIFFVAASFDFGFGWDFVFLCFSEIKEILCGPTLDAALLRDSGRAGVSWFGTFLPLAVFSVRIFAGQIQGAARTGKGACRVWRSLLR